MNHPSIPKPNPNANVHSVDELERLSRYLEELVADNTVCNDPCCTVLDLSSFSNLRLFEVSDYCFAYVKELRITGMKKLQVVLIGRSCFTRVNSGHFYLKNCERLRELKSGWYSFSDYSVCEIENVPSLEVIEMGELGEESDNFFYASLELKSDCERME